MQRNWELIREILLKVESLPNNGSLKASDLDDYYDLDVISHFALLGKAGYVEVIDVSSLAGENYICTGLTWAGHDFLEKVRDDTIWKKTVSLVKAKGVELSFDTIKIAVGVVVKNLFE
ncbi:DUF2513 domain-containing protein [Serratia fonticola]|uniref:DUF2513 domain-containing protein n=1 Tax=Serratia fonticola TaxID=47917 RepID=UPI0034C6343F